MNAKQPVSYKFKIFQLVNSIPPADFNTDKSAHQSAHPCEKLFIEFGTMILQYLTVTLTIINYQNDA